MWDIPHERNAYERGEGIRRQDRGEETCNDQGCPLRPLPCHRVCRWQDNARTPEADRAVRVLQAQLSDDGHLDGELQGRQGFHTCGPDCFHGYGIAPSHGCHTSRNS